MRRCRDRRDTQTALTGLFRRRSYSEVSTPEVEFYDLFVRSGNPIPQESMLKIIDRSGKIMVCVRLHRSHRPGSGHQLQAPAAPQRLYYAETVFRSGDQHRGGSSEIAQCGVELIGAAGRKADLEMIAMAVDALRACGLGRFHIELGHAGFFRSLAERMELEEDQVEELRTLIEGKNFAALGDFLASYRNQSAAAALGKLSRLFGGAEVLGRRPRPWPGKTKALSYLRELYEALCGAGYGKYLRFDLGLVHQIDYYTGVVFRGYAEGAGDAVLSGGRYDRLVAILAGPPRPPALRWMWTRWPPAGLGRSPRGWGRWSTSPQGNWTGR